MFSLAVKATAGEHQTEEHLSLCTVSHDQHLFMAWHLFQQRVPIAPTSTISDPSDQSPDCISVPLYLYFKLNYEFICSVNPDWCFTGPCGHRLDICWLTTFAFVPHPAGFFTHSRCLCFCICRAVWIGLEMTAEFQKAWEHLFSHCGMALCCDNKDSKPNELKYRHILLWYV